VKHPQAVVIDTNVLVVANGHAPQAGQACVLNCANALGANPRRTVTVLDCGGLILDEYFRNASRSGQPGQGDAFAKWLFDHQYQPEFCELVGLSRIDDEPRTFEEFPEGPDLAGFDPADRKFIAAAKASAHAPRVLQATDTKWWTYRDALVKHGVPVEFLCPELMG
jgi:hypothetical protein